MSDSYVSPFDQARGAGGGDLSDLYQPNEEGGVDLPDFDELLGELERARSNPNLSYGGRQEVDRLIAGLTRNPEDVPELPFEPDEPGIGTRVLNRIGHTLGYFPRTAFSAINQAGLIGERLRDATIGPDPDGINRDEDNPVNRLGLGGFISGIRGEGEINLLSSVTGSPDLPFGLFDEGTSFNIPDAIPLLPDRLPAPDIDTLINLGGEIAFDPLTYVRGPGFVRPGQVASTARDARLGWENIARNLTESAAARGYDNAIQEQIARSLYNGSITTLVRDAARGVGGLSRQVLDDIGVQSRLTFVGREIPGTGRFVESVLGAFQPRAVGLGRAARVADEDANLFQRFKASVENGTLATDTAAGVLRGIDSLDASALRQFGRKIIQDGGSPLMAIKATDFARATKTASESYLSLASNAADAIHSRTGLIDGIPEKELRRLVEDIPPAADGIPGRANMSPFQRASDDLVRAMDEAGLQMNSEELVDFLDEFVRDGANDFVSRYMAPFIAYGMQILDRAADNFLPGKGRSFSAGELIGGGRNVSGASILNRRTPTLRSFFEGIAQVSKMGESHVFGATALGEYFFQVGNLPLDVFQTFQQAFPVVRQGFDILDEVTQATRTVAERTARGDATLVDDFERFILQSKDDAFRALSEGDLSAVEASINNVISTGTKHLDSLDRLINSVVKDEGAATFYADKRFGQVNIENAARLTDEDLAAQVDRIIKNEWFNPELSAQGSSLQYTHLVSPEDRAILREAHLRNPDMILTPLDDLREWMDEWTVVAQDTFAQYDAHFTPEIAAQLKKIDTVFHQTMLLSRVFGDGIQSALGTLKGQRLNQSITREGAENLARQILDIHYKNGGSSFFGSSVGQWANFVHDNDQFLKSLKRAELSHRGADAMLGAVAKYNRTFRPSALFGPGSQVRNFMGQIRLNFLRGVRTTGRGGYREWEPYYRVALRAMEDEAVNFTRPGSSSIWKEIPAKDRGMVQEIAESGVLTSTGSGGNVLDRALELQERSVGRGLGRFTDALARGQNRIEQFTVTGAQAGTSLRRPGLRYSELRNDASGIRRATRRELETYMRGALAWSAMAKDGGSIETALSLVSSTHFDYWDLTNAGQIADEAMPFFVFRARVARLSAELAVSTPSVPLTQFKLHAQEDARDPYGAGSDEEWTFGAGKYAGVSWNLSFDDPLDQGYATLLSFADTNPSPQGLGGLLDREVYADLTPAISPLVDATFETRESFGDVAEDYWQPAKNIDGLGPRVAQWLGQAPVVNEILEATGNMRRVDGEVELTRSGADFLTDFAPLLGRVETLFKRQLIGGDTRRALEGGSAKARVQLERQTLNAVFSWAGIPYQLVSDDQRQGFLDSIGNEVYDYDRLVSGLAEIRAEEGLPG